MEKQTRRGFLQASASVATIGALAAVPALSAVTEAQPEAASAAATVSTAATDVTELSATEVTEPLMAHVRDVTTGEVSLFVGTREIVYRDAELVMRLLRATR